MFPVAFPRLRQICATGARDVQAVAGMSAGGPEVYGKSLAKFQSAVPRGDRYVAALRAS